MKKSTSIKVQLTNAQVKLAVLGAITLQVHPDADLSQTAKHCIKIGEPLLSYEGAKMYPRGGGWWELRGYSYKVEAKMSCHPVMAADERETLRMIGFAI